MISSSLQTIIVLTWCATGMALRAADHAATPELTFFVVSDTHYGLTPTGDETLPKLVDAMNALPGTPYPGDLGGVVDRPRGVIHGGDCTNDGKAAPWQLFVKDYGLDGTDGRLKCPVYETFGNHDGGAKPDNRGGNVVRSAITERTRHRVGLESVSDNGRFYTWRWEDIRFISLGISPGPTTNPYDPEHSIDYAKNVLGAPTADEPPTFLIHHFGFDKEHSLGWWPEEWRTAYAGVLKGHNIAGIIHGHAHKPYIYQWEGYDIYKPPHFLHTGPKNTGEVKLGFFVFRIVGNALTVAERKLDGTWGMTATKTLKR